MLMATKKTTPKKRTTKATTKPKAVAQSQESDSAYVLKLVLFLILGSIWVKVGDGDMSQIPIPVGFVVGIAFAMHDHFQIDRKIEYALLLVSALVGFWLPIGIYVSL